MNLSRAHRFFENGADVTYGVGVGVAMGDQRTLPALWSSNCRKIYRDLQHRRIWITCCSDRQRRDSKQESPYPESQIKEKYR